MRAIAEPKARVVRAPRGRTLSCKGWQQEAALRMLMNNLDPEVAERPGDLVVYGGTGKAARNWECFDAIVASLRALENDETLLVQSGKPVAVFRTHAHAPRVLIANSNLVGRWATWEQFRELERLGPHDVRPNDRRFMDLHRSARGSSGDIRDVFGRRARPFRRVARGEAGRLRRHRRHGRRAAARRDDEGRGDPRHRGRSLANRKAPRSGYCDRIACEARRGARDLTRHQDKALSVGLVGNCADVLPELVRRGITPDIVTDQTSAHDPLNGYVPTEWSFEDSVGLARARSPGINAPLRQPWVARGAMLAMQSAGAVVFDYGNNIRTQAKQAGVEDAFNIPGFVPEYIRPLFCEGRGPFRWAALSGDPEDIDRTDRLSLNYFPHNKNLADGSISHRADPFSGIARANLLARLRRAGRVRDSP